MTAYGVSLSSSAFLGAATSYYKESSAQIALSTARLSSGNRLVRASDDVAALSISTRMQGELVAMRQASNNLAQGNSMLQIAYSSLSNISDILDRMDALATQANSGALTSVDRGMLQTEFSELYDQIDSIAGSTRFNNINLLDGTLSGGNIAETTTTQATKATGSLVFSAIAGTNTIKLNGATITAGTDFAVGGDLSTSLTNLVNFLNSSTNTALSGATYTKQGGNTVAISYDSGGTIGNLYYMDQAGSTATFTTNGASTAAANIYTLSGGLDNGLNAGSVTASGTIGDALVTAQAQTKANTTIAFSSNATNGETITIDDGNGSAVTFTFVAASASSTQITIGSSTEETIANAISKMSQYSGSSDFGIRNLEFERDGTQLIIRSKQSGNPLDYAAGAALNVTETVTGATISTTTLNNGTNTGVNTTGVNNADFIGTISGFTATYNSADNIDLELTVGDSTYSASISDTTPVGATTVQFNSTDGGFFEVQIAALGQTVADQDDADAFAAHLNAAFAGLEFSQKRNVSSFTGVGDLAGGTATIQLNDFTTTTPKILDIQVSAASGSNDAVISLDLNGETFESGGISDVLGAYETITLTSTTDVNRKITFTLGTSSVDLSTQTLADDFEEDLRASFGLTGEGGGVDFQVGSAANDTINVNIGSAYANQLFGGVVPNINTQSGAEDASDLLETAKNNLNEAITKVGVLQERFDFASANINTTITGLDEARANLADTDVVAESTAYATATLKNNAAIAIIAQTQKLQSGILSVLDFG